MDLFLYLCTLRNMPEINRLLDTERSQVDSDLPGERMQNSDCGSVTDDSSNISGSSLHQVTVFLHEACSLPKKQKSTMDSVCGSQTDEMFDGSSLSNRSSDNASLSAQVSDSSISITPLSHNHSTLRSRFSESPSDSTIINSTATPQRSHRDTPASHSPATPAATSSQPCNEDLFDVVSKLSSIVAFLFTSSLCA